MTRWVEVGMRPRVMCTHLAAGLVLLPVVLPSALPSTAQVVPAAAESPSQAAANAIERGDYGSARALLERAIEQADTMKEGSTIGAAMLHEQMGDLLATMGEPWSGLDQLRAALRLRAGPDGAAVVDRAAAIGAAGVDRAFAMAELQQKIGAALIAKGSPAAARSAFRAALEAAASLAGDARMAAELRALDGIATTADMEGDPQPRVRSQIALLDKECGSRSGDHDAPATILLATALLDVGYAARASDLYKEAIGRAVKAGDMQLEARGREALAAARLRALDPATARGELERALAIRTQAGDQAGAFRCLMGLAEAKRIQEGPIAARPVLERAQHVAESAFGPRSAHLGVALMARAATEAAIGAQADAVDLAGRGLAILKSQTLPTSTLVAAGVLRLAHAMRGAGHLEGAAVFLEALPPGADMLDGEELLGGREVLLAEVRLQQGRPEEARSLLLAVLDALDQSSRSPVPLRTTNKRLGGDLWFGPSDPSGVQRFGEIRFMLTGSRLYERHGFYQIYGLGSSAGWQVHRAMLLSDPRSALFFEVTARLLAGSGKPLEAAAVLRWGIQSATKNLGPGHPVVAVLLADLAEVLWDADSEDGHEPLPGQDDVGKLGWAYGGMPKAGLKVNTGADTWDGALGAARASTTLIGNYLRDVLPVLPESDALHLVRSRSRPESVLFSGLVYGRPKLRPEWLAACWDWSLNRRAIVQEVLGASRRQALGAGTPAAAEALQTLQEARRQLAALWVSGPDPGDPLRYTADLDRARRARDDAEEALARIGGGAGAAGSLSAVDTGSVARSLPARAALVEYVRVPVRSLDAKSATPHYIALVLTKRSSGTGAVDLGPAADLETMVRDYNALLRAGLGEVDPIAVDRFLGRANEVRRAVWDPLKPLLDGIDLVFIVPDGALTQVHLGALPDGREGYLVESGPGLHYLTSGREVISLMADAAPAYGRGALLLSDPDFDADATVASSPAGTTRGTEGDNRGTACPALRRLHWDRLPHSQEEAAAIAGLFGDGVVALEGAEATESRFRQEAPGRRYLHLATHAFALPAGCDAAAAAAGRGIGGLRPADETGPASASDATAAGVAGYDSPLLLAGVVLAGANRIGLKGQEDDGILTAEELSSLDLRGTELVALSACDTGLGMVEVGEGVFGLRRALEMAGVRTVLTSLWPVPDQAARDWMTVFYRARLGGASVLAASRSATLEQLAQARRAGAGTHPALWAGFVASGAWN